MEIWFDEDGASGDFPVETMRKAAERALLLEGVDSSRAGISVSFVDKEEIRRLNREYRGSDNVTDVLSFPQYESPGDFPEEGELCLGDVVICEDRMHEQAAEYGNSYEREAIYLFTHSLLHLLGYDHIEEEGLRMMRAREEEIMKSLGLGRSEEETL